MSGLTPSFLPSPSKPKLRLPKGACDSHVHVFGPAGVFPYAKDAPRGADQPDFRALLVLMEDRRVLVKVSGPERCSRQAAPYRDAIPLAAKLVAEFGRRAFWGTDWPHPQPPQA